MTKRSIALWITVLLTSASPCLASKIARVEAQKKKTTTVGQVRMATTPSLRLIKHHKSEGDVDLVVLNKSGNVAATYFGQDYKTERKVRKLVLWDTSKLSQIAEYNITCRDICFGEDEDTLLIVDSYGIKQMNIKTGEIKLVLEGEYYKAAYNPLDNNIIFYSDEIDAYYYNHTTGTSEHLHTVSKGAGVYPFRFYRFTNSHLQIMMCRNYTLQIDLKDYTTKKVYFSEDSNCRPSLALSPDEDWLLEEGRFCYYRLYKNADYMADGERARPQAEFSTDNINFETIKYLDGGYLLWGTVNGRSVEIWDMKTLKMVSSFVHRGKLSYVNSIAHHPEKRLIVVGSLYGVVCFFKY
ncbi:MAG: hypothetical protein Q4A64_01345 [Porphyromonadaceae bacterium]|nr:hypothetical protein [Porphyromonadaceae bacterium]